MRKKLPFAECLLILSIIVWVVTGAISSFFTDTYRVYETVDGEFDYTIGDLMYYLGQSTGALLFFWFARIKVKAYKLPKCMAQWVIDLCVVDLAYEIFTNPYVWVNAKIWSYVIATGIFMGVYYMEYVALWKYNLISKFKNVFKRK